MTGDQQSEHLDQDENTGNVERFRVVVGARLARLGPPVQVTTMDAQIEDADDDVDGHTSSLKQE